MEPIKIEVTLKADKSLTDLVVYLGQCLLSVQKSPVEPQNNGGQVNVQPEGEITGTVVKEEPKEEAVHPGTVEEGNPFEGVDEENSVDLSDMEDPKPTGDTKPVTHEDARVAIKEARERGIGAPQVKAIITGMGYEMLDSVPVEKLPEFIAKVKAL